ncbi:MAG: MoaD/ThiS family protein [Moorellales bacterium]
MRLKVKLFATLRRYAPPAARDGEFTLEVPQERFTVADLLRLVRLPEQAVAVVMINGMVAPTSSPLEEGAEISVFPPLAGG